MEISHIIQGLLKARGWTQEELANAVGTKQNNVSRWLAGVEPRGAARDTIMRLARESGVIEDERADHSIIPIMGSVGAGAKIDPDYEQVPPDGFDQVELPFALGEDIIGFRVDGDSMLPKFAAGAIVVVSRSQTRATSSLVGEMAAVVTARGHRYLKVIMPGSKPHLYNLESFNASPIVDQRITWASEIIATVEPRHVKRVERQKTRRGNPHSKKGVVR